VVRFLSKEWFEELDRTEHGGSVPAVGTLGPAGDAELVIEVVVTGAPEGEVSYQLVLGERARVVPPGAGRIALAARPGGEPQPPRVRFTGDYPTLAGIAAGELSAYEALLSGRARVSGEASRLSEHLSRFSGLDLLPAAVRTSTVF
jgi:hypothetical protein